MKTKQTAVNLLEELIHFECQYTNDNKILIDYDILDNIINQAKQMGKEQIMQAFKDCHDLGHIYGLDTEQYYNEIYGK